MLGFLKKLLGRSAPAQVAGAPSVAQKTESRQRADTDFQQLVSGVKDYAIFLLDPQGRVQSWNEGAERIKGYRRDEIVGEHFSRFYPKDAVATGVPAYELQQAAAVGRFEDEGFRLRKDGSRFWADVVITALRDDSGAVRGYLKITRDQTERKQSEERLHASEERFRLLVERVRDYAIFMLDREGRVATWNAGAERIKGYAAEEILGEHFSRFYTPEDVAARKPERELALAVAKGTHEEEAWRVRKNGSRFWASVIITALRDDAGLLRGFAKVTRDMTERKAAEDNERRLLQEEAARRAAEASLREAELAREDERRQRQQLHVTLASIGDAVIVTDSQGIVTFLNAVAAGLTGWTQQDAAGQPLERVFRIVNEQTRQLVENPVVKVIRQGTIVGLANHTLLIARDGSERPIDDSGAPIADDRGQITGVVLVFRDVTERRRAERELREADRRKDEFLAMLAHELRNPLAPIRNALHVMKVAGTDVRAVEQARQMTERQVGHLVRLVDDLLDVSRIMLGRIELRKGAISLASVIQSAVETAQPKIDSHENQLILSLPAEPLWTFGDFTRLTQVVANLVHNAAKFSQRSGRIWLSAERQRDEAVLSVRDEGVGISGDLLPRIFDLFVQGDRSLERSEGGLGIGLTLVRMLVEMHGGTVTARSEGPGAGTEFVVRLPVLREAPKQQQEAASPRASRATQARRVLVVDDNIDAAESVAMILRLDGHQVRLAHDGAEALRAAEQFEPDVVVLDIGLPGMNGYEVAERLRRQARSRKPVLVALTGYAQESDRQRAAAAGFDHHLTKPVEPVALQDLLASLPGDARPAGLS
jgi:hypothetical protein